MAGHAGGGFHVDDNTVLLDLFGPPEDYNNFQEPKPWTNEASTLIGFVTAFLVRTCFKFISPWLPTN